MPHCVMCSHCDESKISCPVEEHRACETCCVTSGQLEEDERAPLVAVAFPFFRLPFDIRWMIYEEVFKTSRADKIITPDPSYHRRQLGRRDAEHTIDNGLAIIQSCQQAHEEATKVLYSSNTFYFDDTSYGVTEIEASASCYYCLEERRTHGDHPLPTTHRVRCGDARDGKHYVVIPRCDYASMYDWLLKIGQKNRLRIRHIDISFSSCQFAKVLGEQHGDDDPSKPSPVGGDLIEKALNLLARGHNLDTFGVSFRLRYVSNPDWPDETRAWGTMSNEAVIWTAFERIFSNGLDHRLKNALSSISGVREMICDWASIIPRPPGSLSEEGGNALEGLLEVKESMECGHADRQMVEAAKQTFSIPFVDQSRHAIHDCNSLKSISSGGDALEELSSLSLQLGTLRAPAKADPSLWIHLPFHHTSCDP